MFHAVTQLRMSFSSASRTTATAAVSAYPRAMCPVPPATSMTAVPGSAGTFLCIQAIRRRSAME